jgi:hypothetical protein
MTDRFARVAPCVAAMNDLSGCDLRVYIAIAAHANSDGLAWPGMTTIAATTGIRRQDVPRTICRLERFRLLRCDPGGGPNGANAYTVIFDDEGVSATLRQRCPQGCGLNRP